MKTRKIITIIITLAMLFTLAACGGGDTSEPPPRDRTRDENRDNPETLNPSEPENNPDETPTGTERIPADPVLNLPLMIMNNTLEPTFLGNYIYVDQNNVARIGISDELLMRDVRSLACVGDSWHNTNSYTYFYIKTDNSLWARGNNANGVLGDNTGVDRVEAVKILDDVANVYMSGFNDYVFALTTDKILYRWGNGIHAPEKFIEDVVMYKSGYVLKTDGSLWSMPWGDNEPERIMGNVKDYDWGMVLKGDNSLWTFMGGESEKLFDDVKSFHVSHIIKTDNTLWGWGNNSGGQLGDGTKISRDEPVKIADNVAEIYDMSFLDTNNNLWAWDSNDPTPKITQENIAAENVKPPSVVEYGSAEYQRELAEATARSESSGARSEVIMAIRDFVRKSGAKDGISPIFYDFDVPGADGIVYGISNIENHFEFSDDEILLRRVLFVSGNPYYMEVVVIVVRESGIFDYTVSVGSSTDMKEASASLNPATYELSITKNDGVDAKWFSKDVIQDLLREVDKILRDNGLPYTHVDLGFAPIS